MSSEDQEVTDLEHDLESLRKYKLQRKMQRGKELRQPPGAPDESKQPRRLQSFIDMVLETDSERRTAEGILGARAAGIGPTKVFRRTERGVYQRTDDTPLVLRREVSKQRRASSAASAADVDGIEDIVRKKYTVLCVDDDAVNQRVMRNLLAAEGYQTQQAMNGEEALSIIDEAFRKYTAGDVDAGHPTPASWIPDVVLLDVMMPGMSGFKVAAELRKKYPHQALPIIMISEVATTATAQRGMRIGADEFLMKPMSRFAKVELLARVRTQIHLKQMWQLEEEDMARKADTQKLLRQILPESVVQRLQRRQHLIADSFGEITVAHIGLVDFAAVSSSLSSKDLILLLNEIFETFDKLTLKMRVHKVETVGECYVAASGHDGSSASDHAQRMLRFAQAVIRASQHITHSGGRRLQVTVGLHSGPASAGLVGLSMPRYCFFGPTVVGAKAVQQACAPDSIAASEDTMSMLPKGFHLTSREGKEIKWSPRVAYTSPIARVGSSGGEAPLEVHTLSCQRPGELYNNTTALMRMRKLHSLTPVQNAEQKSQPGSPKGQLANAKIMDQLEAAKRRIVELEAELKRRSGQPGRARPVGGPLSGPPTPLSFSSKAPGRALAGIDRRIAEESDALMREAAIAASRITREAMARLRAARAAKRRALLSPGRT